AGAEEAGRRNWSSCKKQARAQKCLTLKKSCKSKRIELDGGRGRTRTYEGIASGFTVRLLPTKTSYSIGLVQNLIAFLLHGIPQNGGPRNVCRQGRLENQSGNVRAMDGPLYGRRRRAAL